VEGDVEGDIVEEVFVVDGELVCVGVGKRVVTVRFSVSTTNTATLAVGNATIISNKLINSLTAVIIRVLSNSDWQMTRN